MPSLIAAPSAERRPAARQRHDRWRWARSALHAVATRWAEQRALHRQRQELATMSDYELHDLGLSRAQLTAVFNGTAARVTDAWRADSDRRNDRSTGRP